MDNTSGNAHTFRVHSLCITCTNYAKEDTDTYICVEADSQLQPHVIFQKNVVLYYRNVLISPFHLKGGDIHLHLQILLKQYYRHCVIKHMKMYFIGMRGTKWLRLARATGSQAYNYQKHEGE